MLDPAVRARYLEEHAELYARVAMRNIRREYPVHVVHLVTGPGPIPSQPETHPAFYASFDWHSCVEMHWVLVRLLRRIPHLAVGSEIRACLDEDLTPEAITTEAT